MRNLIAGILILVAAGTVCAQESGPDIGRYIGMIEKGQEDHVKAELPALLSR